MCYLKGTWEAKTRFRLHDIWARQKSNSLDWKSWQRNKRLITPRTSPGKERKAGKRKERKGALLKPNKSNVTIWSES